MSAASVLRALPRRASLGAELPRLKIPESPEVKASLWDVLRRTVLWGAVGALTVARILGDASRGKRGVRFRAIRIREAFELLGGPAVKLGQQLSIRVDLLPFEFCDELSKLTDRVPSFPWSKARNIILQEIGRPPEELFASISEAPIGSASIAAVWKGTLPGGELVAIKVQRPDVASQFAADLTAFDIFTETLERTTLVRPGFFTNMRSELRGMFLEELDFRTEARYQTLYRRALRRDRFRWAIVPRVHHALSSRRVIVTDFISAKPMSEVLQATDHKDAAQLDALAADGIYPELLAKRVMTLSLWGRFEAPLFHADPHPANLMVLPRGRVVVLDFGACGFCGRKSARNNEEMVRRFNVDGDVAGVAAVAAYDISPLPAIASEKIQIETEYQFAKFYFAAQDPHSEWWERTTAGLWLKMLQVSQRYQISLNLDTLRMIRSTLLYDSLAFRLDPELKEKVFQNYLKDAVQRRARRARRRERGAPEPTVGMALRELPRRAELASGRVSAAVEELTLKYQLALNLLTTITLGAVRLTTLATTLTTLALLWLLVRELLPRPALALEAATLGALAGAPSQLWDGLGLVAGLYGVVKIVLLRRQFGWLARRQQQRRWRAGPRL